MGSKGNGALPTLRDRFLEAASRVKIERVDDVPGVEFPVWIRELSEAEAMEWVSGLGEERKTSRRKLILLGLCNEDGTRLCDDLESVGGITNRAANFLFNRIHTLNKLGADALDAEGKDSAEIPANASSSESPGI